MWLFFFFFSCGKHFQRATCSGLFAVVVVVAVFAAVLSAKVYWTQRRKNEENITHKGTHACVSLWPLPEHACVCVSVCVCVTCTIYAAFAVDSFGALWRRRRRRRWRWRPFAACPYTHFKLFIFTLCCNTLEALCVCARTHMHARPSLYVCVCYLIHLAGNASCFGHGFSFGLRQAEKNRDRSLYLHNLALAAFLSPFLSRSLLLYLSRRLAFLFRTCKLFAFCLIPYTYAHKLSWVYVLNFTSHVKAVQGLPPSPTALPTALDPGRDHYLLLCTAFCCVLCPL